MGIIQVVAVICIFGGVALIVLGFAMVFFR